MHSRILKIIGRLLVASLLTHAALPASANMVGAEQLVSVNAPVLDDRQAILALVSRADVASDLRAQGQDPKSVEARVNVMTDDEVRVLRHRINSLPAGEYVGGGSYALIGLGVVAIVALIVAILFYVFKK